MDTKSDIVWDLDWHVLPQFGRVMMIGRLRDVWEKKSLQPSAIVKVRSSLLINLHCWWPECNLSLTFLTTFFFLSFIIFFLMTCDFQREVLGPEKKHENVSRGFLEFLKVFYSSANDREAFSCKRSRYLINPTVSEKEILHQWTYRHV